MEPKQELLRRIGKVRKRWNRFIWLKGLAWVLGVGIVGLLVSMNLAESESIPGWAVVALRLGMLGALIGTAVKMLVLPLMHRPDEIHLARFVEEKKPGVGRPSGQRGGVREEAAYRQWPVWDSAHSGCPGSYAPHSFRRSGEPPEIQHFCSLVGCLRSGAHFWAVFCRNVFPLWQFQIVLRVLVDLPPGPDYIIEVTPGDVTVSQWE